MTELPKEIIRQNYLDTVEKVTRAAQAVGRNPADIKLIVVTKAHSVDVARAAVEAGAQYLGENYLQEALPKLQALSDMNVEWHMIGHVQSRKAKDVAQNFDWVHSLDSLKLARRYEQFAAQAGRKLPVLLECNVSGEASKHGWPVGDEENWPAFAETLAPLTKLAHLQIRGLMTMPPFFADPELARPHFQRLRRLNEFLAKHYPQENWSELSMGMSGDYEIAVQEGATMIRVGTAIVGSRYR